MEQYDNALRDKVEKEYLVEFNSFNSKIFCEIFYNIENLSGRSYEYKVQKAVSERVRR